MYRPTQNNVEGTNGRLIGLTFFYLPESEKMFFHDLKIANRCPLKNFYSSVFQNFFLKIFSFFKLKLEKGSLFWFGAVFL